MYLEGAGLTATKKVGEYLISLIFVGAIVLLVRKRSFFDPSVVRLLVAALLLFIASEITFTFYVSVYGEANMVGHILRLMASYALYKAIIETGLERPYALLLRDLKRSQEKLEEYATALESQNQALTRSEHRLREDATLLEQRNVELDAYAHTVAHDLKNPLSVIIAAAEMVREEKSLTPRRKQELLEEVEATARHMDEIVDDLLTLSEVRKVDAPSEPVRMAEVVENVRDRLSVMIRKRGAELVVPPEWPTPLGYAPWIEEVWANFVSNALKYGGRPPRVELGADREAEARIKFWVKDNGAGVPEGIRSRLFLPFQRLGAPRKGGHGLGLSIVQQIMTKLGGQVGVEGGEGGGSLFYFVLPEAERAAVAAADPPPDGPGLGPGHPTRFAP
jgi:signal transduction histidine kinase